jgi:hypothetical protein
MLGTIAFLAVAVSQPCDTGIAPRVPIMIEGQRTACVQYASDASSRVTVYGLEASGVTNDDFPHRVFVSYGRRRSHNSWSVSDRHEITGALLDAGERGYFYVISARVNRFTLGGIEFVDVAVMTTISGSGGITSETDFIYRIDGGKLDRAAKLRDTDGWARGGWSFMQQVSSELLVGQDQLIWVRRSRTARGTKFEVPLTVHCRVSRVVYRLRDGRLERAGDVDAREVNSRRAHLHPLPRFETRDLLPCCAGCSINN